ncbi:MAG: hypothetical protein HGA85_07035, partial [Nanoarchaeota archaeon]|nr:hypothetical protein [Nanoarchaeota archaeon]
IPMLCYAGGLAALNEYGERELLETPVKRWGEHMLSDATSYLVNNNGVSIGGIDMIHSLRSGPKELPLSVSEKTVDEALKWAKERLKENAGLYSSVRTAVEMQDILYSENILAIPKDGTIKTDIPSWLYKKEENEIGFLRNNKKA